MQQDNYPTLYLQMLINLLKIVKKTPENVAPSKLVSFQLLRTLEFNGIIVGRMDIKLFRKIVVQAIDSLPDEFKDALENIEVVVDEWPTNEQLGYFEGREGLAKGKGHMLLLGLYQGVPKDKRDPSSYRGVLPDKITLFSGSIEKFCGGDEIFMEEQIKRTLLHEIGHYFGLGERRLRELGY